MKKLAILLLLVFFVVVLTGCGEDFTHEGHELVGSWRADGNHAHQIIFNADGTGARTTGRETNRAFDWTIRRNGNLRISFENETETHNLAFDDNDTMRMWIPNSGTFMRYLPTRLPEYLQGTWVWDQDDSYTLVLYENGRGHRGFDDDRQRFGWMVEERDHLIFAWSTPTVATFEPWSYVLEGDVLTITTRLRGDSTQWSYIRVRD